MYRVIYNDFTGYNIKTYVVNLFLKEGGVNNEQKKIYICSVNDNNSFCYGRLRWQQFGRQYY